MLNVLKCFSLSSLFFSLCVPVVWAADEDVLSAQQAAARRDLNGLALAQQRLDGSVLQMYPDYWRLNLDLANLQPRTILEFAQRFPQAALTEKLAADYAEIKAKQGQFEAVRQVASLVQNPDLSERCALTAAQVAGGDTLALTALRDLVWLKTDKLPDTCQTVNQQLQSSQLLTAAQKQQRLWTLLRVGQVSAAIDAAAASGVAFSNEQLAATAANAEAQLSVPVQNSTDQALFVYALARVAERSPELAAQNLSRLADSLPTDLRRYAYRVLAMSSTGRWVVNNGFDSRTVGWFDQSMGYGWSDEEAELYARHAVRHGAWESVLRALDSMTFDTQQKREWQYWFARASEQRDDPKNKQIANYFYQALASETDYYGLLARDRLGVVTNSLPKNDTPSEQDRNRMENNVHFQRAFALRAVNADAALASREWNWAVYQANVLQDEGMILAAAERADRIEWYDRAIYASERTSTVFNPSIRFPLPYREQVLSYSQQVGLDAAWAYGLMRQESRFIINARSHVGAGGLMQIMPDTGRWIARRLGDTYSQAKLNEMNTNIRYGTFYLSHVLQQLSSSPVLATAGYNAGPTRAKRWQPLNAPLSADQYTESIPFLETRDYVKNVMTNAVHYALILNQGQQSIGARMGVIPTQTRAAIEGP